MSFPTDSPSDLKSLVQADSQALTALEKLTERGSLDYLTSDSLAHLDAEFLKWLYWAESNKGSEIIYRNDKGKVRGIPLNSFFDFPDKYSSRIQSGAFVSLELEDGRSLVLYLTEFNRENLLLHLETARQNLPVTTDRPLQERILDKLKSDGHFGYLSSEGLHHLSLKLLKYLDYAVNIRPGSEIIYLSSQGQVRGDALEKVLEHPDKFRSVQLPAYLAIEVGTRSVVFDTSDLSPAHIKSLINRAHRIKKPSAESGEQS